VSTDAVTLFFALLAVLAQLGTLVALVLWIGRRHPVVGRWGEELRRFAHPLALPLATAVAVTATAGSLYLSEVAHFPPCTLCWYQRIAMYPLAVICAVAWAADDRHVRRYVVPIAGIGAVVSIYHLVVERFPDLGSGSCDPTNPCSIIWVEHFGYLTIPAMALSGFLAIIVLVLVAHPSSEPSPHDHSLTPKEQP
jgi:disulfide bond formation protein DsbB